MSGNLKYFHPDTPFRLESGEEIRDFRVAYHTFGKLNRDKSNVIWVCHALTANSNVPEWWGRIAGPGGYFDPKDYYIVCANMLGSPYGSTSPLDISPDKGSPYYDDFPDFTMRDIVNAQLLLKQHLGINRIFLCMGGSCGGQQVLEMAAAVGESVEHLMVIAASARETAWSVAFHAAQRMAIETDPTWGEKSESAGSEGLKTARGIGLLGYRTYEAYVRSQTDEDDKLTDLKAESYIRYQGEKLERRFNAWSYWYLTRALDTHHLGRGRDGTEKVLQRIKSRALILGIDSDLLIPTAEQRFIAENLPNGLYREINSQFGHDGFLIEQEQIVEELDKFVNSPHGI